MDQIKITNGSIFPANAELNQGTKKANALGRQKAIVSYACR